MKIQVMTLVPTEEIRVMTVQPEVRMPQMPEQVAVIQVIREQLTEQAEVTEDRLWAENVLSRVRHVIRAAQVSSISVTPMNAEDWEVVSSRTVSSLIHVHRIPSSVPTVAKEEQREDHLRVLPQVVLTAETQARPPVRMEQTAEIREQPRAQTARTQVIREQLTERAEDHRKEVRPEAEADRLSEAERPAVRIVGTVEPREERMQRTSMTTEREAEDHPKQEVQQEERTAETPVRVEMIRMT